MSTKTQLTGGSFQDAEGNLLSGGYLTFKLNQDCQVNSSTQVCSGIEIKILLDGYGSIIGGQFIWGNDQLSPVNSFYKVTGYKANGQLAWGPNNQQVTGSGGSFDVGTWVPNQVISWIPSLQTPTLQTNEVLNADQTFLDLHAGSGIALVDNGLGRVTISSTATGGILTANVTLTPTQMRAGISVHYPILPTVSGKDIFVFGYAAKVGTFSIGWTHNVGCQLIEGASGGNVGVSGLNVNSNTGLFFYNSGLGTIGIKDTVGQGGLWLQIDDASGGGNPTADGDITFTVFYQYI